MSETALQFADSSLGDATEQAALQPWLPIDYRQLTAGLYFGRFREITLSNQRLVSEFQTQTVLKRGMMAQDICTVSFVRAPDVDGIFSEYPITASAVYFCPAGTEFDVKLSGNSEAVYFSFDQTRFLADAMVLDEAYWSAHAPHLFAAHRTGELAAFADTLLWRLKLSSMPSAPDQLARLMIANALAAFDRSAAENGFDAKSIALRRRALQVVRRARDYINHALDSHEFPTIIDVCRHTGVSQRSLQYCFLDVIELTPVAYLRLARLHRVRAALRDPDAAMLKVGDVAARWGFWHLGKFAGDYQRLFGELPSETLRQRRSMR
jgi:AraC family transcriptional regulator, ethanolamine operon transcriptional activator